MASKEPQFVAKQTPTRNFAYVIFGDGMEAVMLDNREYKDEDGIWQMQFDMNPTKALIEAYGITEEELAGRPSIIKTYPKNKCHQMSSNVNKIRWFVELKYDGTDSYFIENILHDKAREIEYLQSENRQLRVALAAYDERMEKLMKYPDKIQEEIDKRAQKIALTGIGIQDARKNIPQEGYDEESAS